MKTKILHQRAVEVAARYHRNEAELIAVLQELDEHRIYRHYECTSLFQYAVRYLKLSEDTALNYITVARKAREVPALKQEIERGSVTVSKVRKISSVITRENQAHWLELAKSLPQKKLEREVARVNPKGAVPEKASYVSGDRLKLELGVSESILGMLRRAQDLAAQSKQKTVSLEETLQEVLECYLERKDPVRKAERAAARDEMRSRSGPHGSKACGSGSHESEQRIQVLPVARRTAARRNGARKPLAARVRHQVQGRDAGRCTYRNRDGTRCEARRWLDVHHVTPVARGGPDVLANLVTLCSAHHRDWHEQGST